MGLFALGIIALDQILKAWVLANFALGEVRPFIPGLLQLRYTQNTGMAFSFLAGHAWVPLILTPLLLIGLGFCLWKKMFPCKVQQLALAAVMAGGLSNWIDRLIHGFVVDMLDPVFMRFAVFNLADCFITLGGIVFFVAYLLSEHRKKQGQEEQEVQTEPEQEAESDAKQDAEAESAGE